MALTRPRYSQIPDSDYKNSCRIVTTTDVTLTGSAPLTYDGVTLVQYDRVLVAGQTDRTQNGIYSVSTLGSGNNGSWVRSKDANANDRLTAGMNTFIEEQVQLAPAEYFRFCDSLTDRQRRHVR